MTKGTKLWKEAREKIVAEQYDAALELLNKALFEEPKNPTFISERGVVYFHMGRHNDALHQMNYAQELEPDNPYRYSSRAYIKGAMKMLDEAIADYEICVNMDPNDPIAYNNLGLLLESKGRMEAAKRRFKQSDELREVLEERGIDSPSKKIAIEEDQIKRVESPVKAIEPDSKKPKEGKWNVVKSIFTERKIFKEYWKFLKSGFKIKKDKSND
jgi:Flp pilus assembly protein TadD